MSQLGPVPIEPVHVPTRSLRRRLSPQDIGDLVARYGAGGSIRALSLEYGVSRAGLCKLLQSEGVALREQGITPDDAERVVRLYETRLTIREVVEQVGYSYGTIRKVLHEHGVVMRATRIGKREAPEGGPNHTYSNLVVSGREADVSRGCETVFADNQDL